MRGPERLLFPWDDLGRVMANYVDAAFTKKHLQDGRTKVVNVLSAEKFAQKRLPGSINVPEEDPAFLDRVYSAVPDKATPVIVHCSSMDCQASTRAARKLEAHGYKEVYDFKAGLQGWQEAGNPFETGAASPTASEPAAEPHGAERPPRPGHERSSRREEPRTPEAPPL
jgi:rhodanese-related sulfurtransferase